MPRRSRSSRCISKIMMTGLPRTIPNSLAFISYNVVTNKPDARICALGNVHPLESQNFSAINSRYLLYYGTGRPLPSTIELFNAYGSPGHLEPEIDEIERTMAEVVSSNFPPDADEEYRLIHHQQRNTSFGEQYYGIPVSKGNITI